MKVKVIGERCTGHGCCWAVAPATFASCPETALVVVD
jgi:ferredoxin